MKELDFHIFWQKYTSILSREDRLAFLSNNKHLYEQATKEQKTQFNQEKQTFLADLVAKNEYLFEKVKN